MTREELILYVLSGLILVLLIIMVMYIINKTTLNKSNCKTLDSYYKENPTIHSLKYDNSRLLKDYFIKSAYNCCATGNFSNDYVNVCALKKCIQQGARFLDFKIYSMDNNPVIAVSSVNNFNYKQSYNSINLDYALQIIVDSCFNSSTAVNYTDPLFLHFRIESKNIKMYNKMAKMIQDKLNNRLLNLNEYGNEKKNLALENIKKFKNKIIIVIDADNNFYRETDLVKYSNIASNGPYMKCLRYDSFIYNSNPTDIIEFNKNIGLTFVMPNENPISSNYDPNTIMDYGVQFIGLSFQKIDNYLIFYNDFFNEKNTAIVLKPAKLLPKKEKKEIKPVPTLQSLEPISKNNRFISYTL